VGFLPFAIAIAVFFYACYQIEQFVDGRMRIITTRLDRINERLQELESLLKLERTSV
jgi:hypothetical protein